MTITAEDYAWLCKDSYNNPVGEDKIKLSGVTYKPVDHYNNPITGYQATAYQRIDTGEVIIANRGTEINFGVIQDGITDLGMVVAGVNAQMGDARAFVHRVKHDVEERARKQGSPTPPITLTGHSLGGAITEVLAHELNMRGVTFNAYGAVDMGYRIPEGGTQVTNYVRVTDVVSAASRHFGKVVPLATSEDIDQLTRAGYSVTVTAQSLRNPASALSFSAHGIDNFASNNPALTPSDLSLENKARAQAYGKAIGLFRADIQALRANTLSLPWELQQKQETAVRLTGLAASAVAQGDFEQAGKIAGLAEHRAVENARHALNTTTNTAMLGIHAIDRVGEYGADHIKQAAREVNTQLDRMGRAMGSEAIERTARHTAQDISQAFNQGRDIAHHLLSDISHPVHALYQQARDAVHRLDTEHCRTPDQRSDNLAASLTVAAHREGMDRIDRVVLSDDATKITAVQDPTRLPILRYASLPVLEAINTSIEQSTAAWTQVARERTDAQALEQTRQITQQHSHGRSR